MTPADAILMLPDGEMLQVIRKINGAWLFSVEWKRQAVIDLINSRHTTLVGVEESPIGQAIVVKDSGGIVFVKVR